MTPIALLTVPYDSGHHALRMGAGPIDLLENGALDRLGALGVAVRHVPIALPQGFWTEVAAALRLQQLVAEAAREARARGERVVVLSGNCNTAVGTLAGIGAPDAAVVWLDAHADFNTPDTTPSGFFDGQALAMVTGRCWRQLAATVPGFSPVADERVLLLGARDADADEAALLRASGIVWVREHDVRAQGTELALAAPLGRLAGAARMAYLHVDLDVHDETELRANGYASAGGLHPDEVAGVVRLVAGRLPLAAAALTAYDPAADPSGRARTRALALLERLATAP